MDSDCLPVDQSTSAPTDSLLFDPVPVNGALGVKVSSPTAAAVPGSEAEDLDSYNLIEPPPLDWRSDSSSEAGSGDDLDDPILLSLDKRDILTPLNMNQLDLVGNVVTQPVQDFEVKSEDKAEAFEGEVRAEGCKGVEEDQAVMPFQDVENKGGEEEAEAARRSNDEDHRHIHTLLSQLQLMGEEPCPSHQTPSHHHYSRQSDLEACSPSLLTEDTTETTGLLFSESHQRDLLGMLQCTEIGATPCPTSLPNRGDVDAVVSVSYSQEDAQSHFTALCFCFFIFFTENWKTFIDKNNVNKNNFTFILVPGPCDPEDLLDGVIFGAKYLGSTQIKSERNPSTNARMAQAQEAVDRIKAPEGESQPMTEVDLFISTQRIKVLTTDTQEAMMDHALQMISYIADIGNIVVMMARRKRKGQDADTASNSSSSSAKKCLMICHVFSSEDAQTIAQAIGQAFGVAYQQFLQTNGIKASDLRPGEYSDYLESQELYNGDLAHFSDSQNLREVIITKAPGEILGLAVVESGWGSILPTVVVANLLHGGPAERCGELSIGDRVMSINGTSLVGLPITTCQNIIRDQKSKKYVRLSIVHCPPVTMAIIRRPDPKFQLGFSVEDGIICSLMRGGIAERGGIRVGHRIIEINGQSVVATPHDKIIQILTNAVGEIHLKTMPASTYRLLTGQEQPVFL
uniref:Amyloid-beta A4 precursor protein-binding family A member 3 n=1 Tax=Amphilophus citrinellus TaxID=61819 RepID=A0A3Q0RBE8_AMPCI